LQRATLSNGLRVVLRSGMKVPLVNLLDGTDAGYAADEFAAPGTANMTMALLTEARRRANALEHQRTNCKRWARLEGHVKSGSVRLCDVGLESEARSFAGTSMRT